MSRVIDSAKKAGPAAAKANSVATYPSLNIGQASLEKARPNVVDYESARAASKAAVGCDPNKKGCGQ